MHDRHVLRAACLFAPLAGCFSPTSPGGATVTDDAGESGTETSTATDATSMTAPSTTQGTETTASTSASTTDDTADATTSATESETDPTGPDTSTTEGGPLCGNGEPDDGEACDDGNEVNGDGCNVDCIESGTLLWELVLDSEEASNENAVGVAISDEDAIAFLWHDGGAPHVTMFDVDGLETGTFSGPSETAWYALDYFGNGDLAISVQAEAAIAVTRFSDTGATVWASDTPADGYGGVNRANAVAVTEDDEVAFAGTVNTTLQGGDLWGGKFEGNGAFAWSDVHATPLPGYGRGTSVACELDGTCVVAGETDANGAGISGGKEVFLRRLAPGGTAIWTRTYSPTSEVIDGVRVAVDAVGNAVVTARELNDAGDIWVRKYDSDGAPQWTHVYDNPNHDEDRSWGIASDADGNVVVVGGEDREDLAAGFNALIQKVDVDGNVLWTRSYGGPDDGYDEAFGVAIDSSGRTFVIGHIERTDGDGSYDVWIRAYAP